MVYLSPTKNCRSCKGTKQGTKKNKRTRPPSPRRTSSKKKRRHDLSQDIFDRVTFDYCCVGRSKKEILRLAICYVLTKILDAPGAEYWSGSNGTICDVRRILQIGKGQREMIYRTLTEVMLCIRSGIGFNGKFNSHKNCGRMIILKARETEEHLIANWMKTGAGFCLTAKIVKEHRRSEGKCEVS